MSRSSRSFTAFPTRVLRRPCGLAGAGLALTLFAGGCSEDDLPTDEELAQRAYVVSEASDELFVVDLATMTEVGVVDTRVGTGGNANHMALVSNDGRKLYVMATDEDAIVVVDAVTLEVTKTIAVGAHDTHGNACFGCGPGGRDELWVVNEGGDHRGGEQPVDHGDGSISVIDMETDEVVRTITHDSLFVPHFVRFSGDFAYVPSIGGNQITVVDRDTYAVTDVLVLDEGEAPGACAGDPCGFADAQIDADGLLFAAHIETGRVFTYDTVDLERVGDIQMGSRPWSVFVDPLNSDPQTYLMPNWGDQTVSVVDRRALEEVARATDGDEESYGVNYSARVPDQAFVLNRVKEQVAVVDRVSGERIELIDVGGTTETGSTTADGQYLLLPISSTGEFVVMDVVTRTEVARFADVGTYPWSVATVGGQNYCH